MSYRVCGAVPTMDRAETDTRSGVQHPASLSPLIQPPPKFTAEEVKAGTRGCNSAQRQGLAVPHLPGLLPPTMADLAGQAVAPQTLANTPFNLWPSSSCCPTQTLVLLLLWPIPEPPSSLLIQNPPFCFPWGFEVMEGSRAA